MKYKKKKKKKKGINYRDIIKEKTQIESDLYFLLKCHDIRTVMRDTQKV